MDAKNTAQEGTAPGLASTLLASYRQALESKPRARIVVETRSPSRYAWYPDEDQGQLNQAA